MRKSSTFKFDIKIQVEATNIKAKQPTRRVIVPIASPLEEERAIVLAEALKMVVDGFNYSTILTSIQKAKLKNDYW